MSLHFRDKVVVWYSVKCFAQVQVDGISPSFLLTNIVNHSCLCLDVFCPVPSALHKWQEFPVSVQTEEYVIGFLGFFFFLPIFSLIGEIKKKNGETCTNFLTNCLFFRLMIDMYHVIGMTDNTKII